MNNKLIKPKIKFERLSQTIDGILISGFSTSLSHESFIYSGRTTPPPKNINCATMNCVGCGRAGV